MPNRAPKRLSALLTGPCCLLVRHEAAAACIPNAPPPRRLTATVPLTKGWVKDQTSPSTRTPSPCSCD